MCVYMFSYGLWQEVDVGRHALPEPEAQHKARLSKNVTILIVVATIYWVSTLGQVLYYAISFNCKYFSHFLDE